LQTIFGHYNKEKKKLEEAVRRSCQKLSEVGRSWKKLEEVGRSWKKLEEVVRSCEKLEEVVSLSQSQITPFIPYNSRLIFDFRKKTSKIRK
jgi:hypothetical protein